MKLLEHKPIQDTYIVFLMTTKRNKIGNFKTLMKHFRLSEA